ncbi:MAG TPA: endonuclease/exonuclease/phosphatase family protein [Polyangia bacterium]|jgi:exodeoxyribonuclease-3|nr:endonuclease/exonuclease/phosphatase family protein [Polyangia bacterium]
MAPQTLDIRSWNVESALYVLRPPAGARSLPQIVGDWGHPAIVCLQELRIRPRDSDLIRELCSILPGYVCHYALADDPVNVTFRGGRAHGVATFIREELHARREPVAWDREGRVVITELPRASLAIVNIYGVNGTDKPYYRHETGAYDGDRHQWKRRVQELLIDEGEALRARHRELVMIGDWNVTPAAIDTHPRLRTEGPHVAARAHLAETLIPRLRLVDVFRALLPAARKYTWFNRRARKLDAARVDYALVSDTLVDRVIAADIDDAPAQRGASDHAPIWIRLRV